MSWSRVEPQRDEWWNQKATVCSGAIVANVLFGIKMQKTLKLPLIWMKTHLDEGSSIKRHTPRGCQNHRLHSVFVYKEKRVFPTIISLKWSILISSCLRPEDVHESRPVWSMIFSTPTLLSSNYFIMTVRVSSNFKVGLLITLFYWRPFCGIFLLRHSSYISSNDHAADPHRQQAWLWSFHHSLSKTTSWSCAFVQNLLL